MAGYASVLFHEVTELIGRLRMFFICVLLKQTIEIEEAETGIVFVNHFRFTICHFQGSLFLNLLAETEPVFL